MKKVIFICLALVGVSAAQTNPSPQLSTSEKVALQTLEQKKQEATQQYQQATQTEFSIVQEFAASHSGWHLDQRTFAPEPNAVPKPSKK